MKRKSIFITFLIALIICAIPTSVAFADETTEPKTETQYILNGTSDESVLTFYIYVDAISSNMPIFNLPKTYYCKYIPTENETDFYKVSYLGIEGFVKKTSAKPISGEGINDTNYCPSTDQIMVQVNDNNIENLKTKTGETVNALYLGPRLKDGKISNQSAIKLENSNTIYFIDNTNISVPTIKNRVSTAPGPTPPIIDGKTPTEPENNLLRVLLIIGICIPSVIIIFLLFKPVKKSEYESRNRHFSHDDYYDEYKDKHHNRHKR